MLTVAGNLPRSTDVVAALKEMQKEIPAAAEPDSLGEEFRDTLNSLQMSLGELHSVIGKTWFMSESA